MTRDHVAPAVGATSAAVVIASCFLTWIRVEVSAVLNVATEAAQLPGDLDLPSSLADALLGGLSAHELAGYGLLVSVLAALAAGSLAGALRVESTALTVVSSILSTFLVAAVALAGAVVVAAQRVSNWVLPEDWQTHAPSIHTAEGLWVGSVASIVVLGAALYQTAAALRGPPRDGTGRSRGAPGLGPAPVPAGSPARDVWS